MSGAMDIVIAAGVESMSRVPMGTPVVLPAKAGLGTPMSPHQQDRYPGVKFSQFTGAEMIAKKYGFTRDMLDDFGFDSQAKAIKATRSGAFKDEIVPVAITLADGAKDTHLIDEGIRFEASREAMAGVKLISEDGVITAATSSQICDGAAGVLIVSERGLKALGVAPLARIHHMTVTGGDPVIMLEEPLFGTEKALKRCGMSIDEIDLYEVNEAFAPVPMAWLRHTKADPAKLNVNGGAIALGHPLGGSGAKLMTTLLYALKARNGRYGLQTMCEGGGLTNVTIIERL